MEGFLDKNFIGKFLFTTLNRVLETRIVIYRESDHNRSLSCILFIVGLNYLILQGFTGYLGSVFSCA